MRGRDNFRSLFLSLYFKAVLFSTGLLSTKEITTRAHMRTHAQKLAVKEKKMSSFRSVIFPVDLGFRMFAEILRSQNEMGILSLP